MAKPRANASIDIPVSRPPSLVSNSSSSRPSSVTSSDSRGIVTGADVGFPFFQASTDSKPIMDSSKPETRPRHVLMRLRRTSMPAVPTTSFLSHNVPPSRSISNGPHPSIATKRMSTASIQSFESLAEETPESINGLTMLSSPLSASTSSLALNDALSYSSRKPLIRRVSPSYAIAERPVSLASSRSSVETTVSIPEHRLSLPAAVATDPTRATSPKRPSRPSQHSQAKLRINHSRKALKRSLTEPPPFSADELARRQENSEKRRKITTELVETERTYVDVLNEIEKHYLDPLMAQSSSSYPIIDRKGITEIFSNFSDIVVLAREVLRRLQFGSGTPRIPEESPSLSRSESAKSQDGFPGLNAASGLRQSALSPPSTFHLAAAVSFGTPGSLLLPLCPFLKCYSLFVQNFSRALARIDKEERTNPAWRRFANERRRAGHDKGLGLSGMLLAAIQRIPRYRLLLEDLVRRTEPDHADYGDLIKAMQSVDQVAQQLECSIREHDATQKLLELQKSFTGLDFPLVSPGRKLLKDGRLTKVCRKNEQQRHFFLFSDMLLYASVVEPQSGWTRAVSMTGLAAFSNSASLMNLAGLASSAPPVSSTNSPQYQYHRHLALNDTTVVGTEGRYFEIRSTEKSFAVSARTIEEKETWLQVVRGAKQELLKARTTLQTGTFKRWEATSPLTSQRNSLYGEPQDLPTMTTSPSLAFFPASPVKQQDFIPSTRPVLAARNRRWSAAPSSFQSPTAVADNYSAPVWVPDHRVDKCGTCQGAFGVWKRKHHCRMCGNVFCWNCTSNTVVIPMANKEDDRGRACNACFQQLLPTSPDCPSGDSDSGFESASNTPNMQESFDQPSHSPVRLALQADLREKLRL